MKHLLKLLFVVLCINTNVKGQHLNFDWAKSFGDSASNVASKVDVLGNIYIIGIFEGTIDIDPGVGTFPLTSNGDDDIYILKLDPTGNFVWAKNIGGAGQDAPTDLEIDNSGNIYLGFAVTGTVDCDPNVGVANFTGNSTYGTSVFQNSQLKPVLKLNASGDFLWLKALGGQSIALDGFGNLYTTSTFIGTVDADPGVGITAISAPGGADFTAVVSKFDTAGNLNWARAFDYASALSLTTDASGNLYISGQFISTTDFDPSANNTSLTATSSWDVYVLKLNASGDFQFVKSIEAVSPLVIGRAYCNDIKVDANENIYIAGLFSDTFDFDPGLGQQILTTTHNNDIDGYILKLDANGQFSWVHKISDNAVLGNIVDNKQDFRTITIDDLGNIYAFGYFQQTVDFDPSPSTHNLLASNGYLCIVKYNGLGDLIYAKQIDGSVYSGNFVSIAGQNSMLLSGGFNGTADFNPGANAYNLSGGYNSAFIVKLDISTIYGAVYFDNSQDCIFDNSESGLAGRNVIIQPGNIIAQTDFDGYWGVNSLPVGNYTVTFDTTHQWQATCPITQSFAVLNSSDSTIAPNIGCINTSPCPSPDVSIYTPCLRPCFTNQTVYVSGSNQVSGTGIMNAAYVDVQLDPLLTVQSASLPFTTSLVNNTYRVQVGNLNIGGNFSFTMQADLSCDAIIGQTLCMEANLYPYDSCVLLNSPTLTYSPFTCNLPYDNSHLIVGRYCLSDSVRFIITNDGTGNMVCYSPVYTYKSNSVLKDFLVRNIC